MAWGVPTSHVDALPHMAGRILNGSMHDEVHVNVYPYVVAVQLMVNLVRRSAHTLSDEGSRDQTTYYNCFCSITTSLKGGSSGVSKQGFQKLVRSPLASICMYHAVLYCLCFLIAIPLCVGNQS